MKIVVTVKLVPDTTAEKRIDPATKRLVRTGVDIVLNPFDEYAIEAALQLRDKLADGSTVTIASMTPESGREVVRKALAMGADDALMVSDPGLAGSDLWATSYALAHAIKTIGFELVADRNAIDRCYFRRSARHAGRVFGRSRIDVRARSQRCRRPLAREARDGDGLPNGERTAARAGQRDEECERTALPVAQRHHGRQEKGNQTLALADLGLSKAVGSDGSRTEVLELATPPAREKGRTVTVSDGAEGARAVLDFLKARQLL